MKILFLIVSIFLSSKTFSFTLNNNVYASFSQDQLLVNMASSTDCSGLGLTNDEVLSLAQEATATYWNRVASSRLRISPGELKSVSSNFATDVICSSGVNSSCIPNDALKVSDNILIACNTNATNFSSSNYVMAVALPNNISGSTINGGLILINATGPAATNVFGNLSREEKISVLAHEIGHAVGLGHSAVKDSLMYYESIESRAAVGWDDIQGITYLYPKEQPLSCSSITNKSNKLPITSLLVFIMFILATKPFSKVIRLSLR